MDLARCLKDLLRMLTPLPRLERTGSLVGCSPAPDGLPLMAGGSAPARNYRGLLRVHVLFGLRICTSVAPRTSPEASGGRSLASPAPVATGRTDNSPDGTSTRWPSRPRRSLRNLSSAHVRPPFVPHCHALGRPGRQLRRCFPAD